MSANLPTATVRGAAYYAGFLDPEAQRMLVDEVRGIVERAPLFHPETRRGQKMSVRMTSAGTCGWISDRRGYRYDDRHPSGVAWPPIPAAILDIWASVVPTARQPDTCLINFYVETARMGLHQDRDEVDQSQPVVSISLGDDALFTIGNETRGGSTESLWLRSGDVLILSGDARMRHHGIDRVRAGSSGLLARGGRLNLTLRVAR